MNLRKIADYTITREVGRGGMGTVYQALSPTGAIVALKTVLWPEGVDPRARWEAIERFQREARAARALSHPNVCQVLDLGADEQSLYIVMEFLDGETVFDLIALAGGIKVARAVAIVRDVGEALAHAHDQNIVHRDVKPGNIMVLRGGQVKLTDFGLSSVIRDTTLSTSGGTMGTVYYMSPEQVRGEKVDPRSDIFSLGATFYEMLAGARPFRGEEPAAVMHQILTMDPPPIPGLPAELSQVLQRCLHKDREERFESAREMVVALSAAGAEAAADSTVVLAEKEPEAVAPTRRRLPRPRSVLRRSHMLAAAAAVLAVGALALLHPWTRLAGQPEASEVTVEAPAASAAELAARPDPPPPYDTPEEEEADVRRRANFRYPGDFDTNLTWFDVGPQPYGTRAIEDGALVVTADPPVHGSQHPVGSTFRAAGPISEFIVEAQVTKREGPDDVGFGVAIQAWPRDFYAFVLYGDGDVAITRLFDGEWKQLNWVESCRAVNQGNAENVMKVVRRHGCLHIFVNDQHVLTVEDEEFGLGAMLLEFFTASGVEVAFSDISVEGISTSLLWDKVNMHIGRLEMQEARDILEYLTLYDPGEAGWRFQAALQSPDRRATVLVVVPSGVGRERYDETAARKLVAKIDEKGAEREFHWATCRTDIEVLADEYLMECPLIAIEDRYQNEVTAKFLDSGLPRDDVFSTNELQIYHHIAGGDGRVALWGHWEEGRQSTADAIDLFISSGLLDRYLDKLWEGR